MPITKYKLSTFCIFFSIDKFSYQCLVTGNNKITRLFKNYVFLLFKFPGGSGGKESAFNVGGLGSIPELR